MVRSHEPERSPTPTSVEPSLLKRMKRSHISASANGATDSLEGGHEHEHQHQHQHQHQQEQRQRSHDYYDGDDDPVSSRFAAELFAPNNIHRLHTEYASSGPFYHVVVEKLIQDELLKKVKDEALAELSFSEKETDIYKVKQTGDLASLSFLTDEQRALLPNLLALRDALYSSTFRSFLRAVTGCGPLSGTKQDMSIVSYDKGCHLLNHDDVIGTRRVSYILYMPLPHYMGWQKEWGGALELYPVRRDGATGEEVPEPEPVPAKAIPPSWNQFVFFEVQPGRSFHSVEEVVVGEQEDGRQRLSISGWFHAAQPDEEGYLPESAPPAELKSSREQLVSTSTEFKEYPDAVEAPLPSEPLSEEDVSFLSEFLNPVYLQARTMKQLASRFLEESSLELHSFLCQPLAERLDAGLRDRDDEDGLGPGRTPPIPPHTAGAGEGSAWDIRGPPHKWRYCTLKRQPDADAGADDASSSSAAAAGERERMYPRWAQGSSDDVMRSLQEELFPSAAFRAWLAVVSNLLPLRYAAEARRFRPGLDYTLATSEAKETRLDVVLGLTPQVSGLENGYGSRNGGEREEELALRGWQSGEWGGWECYMAPHDEEDDPAVYRSARSAKSKKRVEDASADGTNGHTDANGHSGGSGSGSADASTSAVAEDPDTRMQEDEAVEEDSDDEDDGTLLTVQPGYNRLLLVLRDEGVMRFVKYVSAAAEGSRWDVCGEFEIGMVEEDDNN